MRLDSLDAELDAITKEFDYGIVPGSATVFVKDETNRIGRLDLTLLEGVMIVLEVTDEGYKVMSHSSLYNTDPAVSTATTIEAFLEVSFESMENLLMTISPMFQIRFHQELLNKLQSVQMQQQKQEDTGSVTDSTISDAYTTSLEHSSVQGQKPYNTPSGTVSNNSVQNQEFEQSPFNEWIN